MKKNGATLLLKSLLNQEIETVFGVPGESYLSVLDALNDFPEISWIGARQEGGAAHRLPELGGHDDHGLAQRAGCALHVALAPQEGHRRHQGGCRVVPLRRQLPAR